LNFKFFGINTGENPALAGENLALAREESYKMNYEKTPGDIFDLFELFIYSLNKDQYIKNNQLDPMEIERKIQPILNGSFINDELFMFFYISNKKDSFMSSLFLKQDYNDFKDPCYFEDMLEKILEMDLFREILKYYTGNDELIKQNTLSTESLYNLLKKNSIPDKIRFNILHLNINKNFYSDLLINELKLKFECIRRLYGKEKQKFVEISTMLANKKTQKDLCIAVGLNPDSREVFNYSVSLIKEKIITVLDNNKNKYVLIGYEAIQQLTEIDENQNDINICQISNALSDNLRINILNLIKEKGEMSTTDIAKTFDKGLTAMFYHLNMLFDAQVLITRNEGRTVFYNINTSFLNRYSAYLKRFTTEQEIKL